MTTLEIAAFALSLIGAVIAMVSYTPGVIKVFKTNDTRGISFLMFGLTAFGCVMSDVYSILMLCQFAYVPIESGKDWAAFIGGFASLFSTLSLGTMAFIIMIKKWKNTRRAKRLGLTENEWFNKQNKKKN